MSQTDTLRLWLKDAYSMERGELPLLEAMARETHAFPELTHKVGEHLTKTRGHMDKVRGCLERLGEPTAAIDAIPACESSLRPSRLDWSSHRIVKDAVRSVAAEHLEIAAYKAILVAAMAADDFQTLKVCEEILDDEEEMAAWLEEHLPPTFQELITGAE